MDKIPRHNTPNPIITQTHRLNETPMNDMKNTSQTNSIKNIQYKQQPRHQQIGEKKNTNIQTKIKPIPNKKSPNFKNTNQKQ